MHKMALDGRGSPNGFWMRLGIEARKLKSIFMEPKQAGLGIAVRPTYIFPILLILVILVLCNLLTVDIQVKDFINKRPNSDPVFQENLQRNLVYSIWRTRIGLKFFGIFLTSAFLFYAARVYNENFRFKTSLSIFVWSEVIRMSGYFITALLVYLTKDPNCTISLALFMPRDSLMFIWLDAFNLFFLWEILAMGAILAVIMKLKAMRGLASSAIILGGCNVLFIMTYIFINNPT